MSAVYRDENEAAIHAAARLREENEALRAKISDLELRLRAAEGAIGMGRRTASRRSRQARILGIAAGALAALVVAGGFLSSRRSRVAAAPSSPMPLRAADLPSQPPVVGMPVSGGDTFDRGMASAMLGKAAMELAACARQGGPFGKGHVSTTFETDGRVSAATVDEPFAGTPVGACVEAHFKQARIPTFLGGAVTVSKAFVIADPGF